MTVTPEMKQSKIQEFADLLKQRENAVQKMSFNLDLNSYEQDLINSPYEDWLRISAMLNSAEIQDNIYNDFLENPTHYTILENEIVFDEQWEEKATLKEQERIAKLHITKQDFYLYICKPVGITYEVLLAKIVEVGMQAEWDLCNHVYYGCLLYTSPSPRD